MDGYRGIFPLTFADLKRLMKRGIAFIVLAAWIICSSWGFLVHRTVNQLAVYKLPDGLRNFFYANMDYVVQHSVRPDLRRNEDSTEDTKHFIDLEAFGDSAAWKMPLKWEQAIVIFHRDSLLKYGYVPYHVIHMKNLLTGAFRSGKKDSILFYAADLAHYIGDAHVPLHTTLNYDGQLTNQKGLHCLWESMIPEIEIDQYDLAAKRKAKYLKQPDVAIWNAVRTSHLMLPELFRQETETSKGFTDSTKYRTQLRRGREVRSYTSDFAKAYSRNLQSSINTQLKSSADLIADFWYTAWVDAGRPDLGKLYSLPEDKKSKLKEECKSFRKNKLIANKQLIAKQAGVNN